MSTYTQAGAGTRRSLTQGFLSAIDLSEQLSVGLHNASSIAHGIPARIYAFVLAIIAIAMGALAWYFDYAATIIFAEPVISRVVGSIPQGYGIPVAAVAFALSVLPTAIEMFAPRLAARSFLISIAFYACLLFDAATDAPRVKQTLALFDLGAAGGLVETIGYWVAYALLLLFASIGFELLFVVCAVCALYLLLRG
jgi:hypothetical protein